MRDDPVVVALVVRAAGDDQEAWNELVERYAPMVWAICLRYRLSGQDIEDVGQEVWLSLVEHLGKLREPAALPGWIATATSRQCMRVLQKGRRSDRLTLSLDELRSPAGPAIVEEEVLAAERNAALRAAFTELSPACRRLLAALTGDQPYAYAEISAILQIPVGSIGPQRKRCLARMRRSQALSALIDDDAKGASLESSGGGRDA